MLWSSLVLAIAAAFAPLVSAQISSIYWPISSPSPTNPWVIGSKNLLAWESGGGTGFIPIALRVKMERLPTGRKNYGGEIEVDLGDDMPVGDNFSLLFMNTLHGQVYAKSQKFSIYGSQPSNYTAPALPTATVTATLTELPNPTQQWALTLDGIDPDATAAVTNIAGNAGSGH